MHATMLRARPVRPTIPYIHIYGFMAMKTTLELPDELMRRLKIRAASSDRKLKDTVEEVIRRGLEATEADAGHTPLEALRKRLRFRADGSITNPDAITDRGFFQSLDDIRDESRKENPRDPFV
jgi:plasmid stability protein